MSESRKSYRSDLSDERWVLIASVLQVWRAKRLAAGLGLAEPKHDLREIVNAVLYQARTGVQWAYLPHDFPPHQTVYGYFAAWRDEGIDKVIHDALVKRVRVDAGRSALPHAAIGDAQSIKTSANVPENSQGVDMGKKIKGRKRHIVTDVLGLILAVLVTAASISDTAGGRDLVEHVATAHPAVSTMWVDNGYQKSVVATGDEVGIDVVVVPKPGQAPGFEPTVRWPVERTFGWFMLHRRLARDYETLPATSASVIYWSMIDSMTRRLTSENTPTWRPPKPDTT